LAVEEAIMSDRYFTDFERDGEDVVSKNVAYSNYNDPKHKAAQRWLQLKEREREESKNAAQLEAASRAAEAAERAAEAAERSAAAAEKPNRRATIANVIAAAAMIISGLALILSYLKP
jgi:ferric-dicitrate binding protein FerR (iron transport regulator)